MPLLRRRSGLSGRERSRLRKHLDELIEEREDQLRELGGIALDMHRRDEVEVNVLEGRAEEITETEEEIQLLQIGLEQGIGVEELQKMAIARREARAAPED
ncbi:MAG: hypothetical protein EXQ70_00225 [Solirubrobacterales bacterium]|nr:hypothetical protein [Solirubrobacterales bacterium]